MSKIDYTVTNLTQGMIRFEDGQFIGSMVTKTLEVDEDSAMDRLVNKMIPDQLLLISAEVQRSANSPELSTSQLTAVKALVADRQVSNIQRVPGFPDRFLSMDVSSGGVTVQVTFDWQSDRVVISDGKTTKTVLLGPGGELAGVQ